MKPEIDYAITYLPITKLSVIWVKSQRAFNEKWARQIAEEFDPDKFDPIVVTKPNSAGMYHIIEGQHRRAAAEIFCGTDQSLPCHVIAEADPARAAELFLGKNNRKPIPPVAKFLVSVVAGRPTEVAINNIVKRAGYHVSERKTDNVITAVAALRSIYLNCGEKTLYRTLQVCRQMWGSDSQGVAGKILAGFGLFIHEFYDHLDVSHLCKVITNQYKSPGAFVTAAQTDSKKTLEPLHIAMADLLRIKYNKGRHENKKLKRKES